MTLRLNELFIAYGVTAFGMLLGLLAMRADTRAYWRWPVYSAMAMSLAVVSWFVLRKHLLPPEWVFTHGALLYYSALTIYAAVGFVLGLLLGRLTRRKTPESDT